MVPSAFIALVLAGWSAFHLMHNFLLGNGWFGPVLDESIRRNNIFISPFKVSWFTQRCNRHFVRIGRYWNLKWWFDSGIVFAAVTMIASTGLLCHTLVSNLKYLPFYAKQASPESHQVLTVIVPGVNLPIQDVGYLAATVLISGILHELGHAIAATREGVHVNGFGLFLFVIYPGAYVDLNSDDLNRANPRKQLRIYCAGIWHNFIICLMACLIIILLPFLLTPLYANSSNGVIVTYQNELSPLRGGNGLRVGDKITLLDHCLIKDIPDWFQCINHSISVPQMGSCVTTSKLHQLDILNSSSDSVKVRNGASSSISHDCCGKDAPATHLCYQYVDQKTEMFACLPGREMMSRKDCLTLLDCNPTEGETSLERATLCVIPNLADTGVRFMRIVVNRGLTTHHVLYVGEPRDLSRYITVSEYEPRTKWLPLRLPAIILRFFQYLFSMSGALALMNIVPCYALDGQWAFVAFIDFIWNTRENSKLKEKICLAVLFSGTFLVAANVVLGFLRMIPR